MRTIRALALWLALLIAAPVAAQSLPATVSAGPDSVALTLYRGYGQDREFDLKWLRGYALVTETRRVKIPAGRSVIRFEGVAGGILPESVVISGLPEGVLEKNLDADLLSPRSLYARSFGRPVTLTHRNANGTMVSEQAIIRSGPDGAAILETKDGIIAADCTGQEAIAYDAVPEGLSAKPTLSIQTNAGEAREVTLTLSYLAWGFDWQVNYVATMREDGKSADLTAWITLASGDITTFADAETMLIAGEVNREDDGDEDRDRFATDQPLTFQCMARHVERIVAEPAPPPPLYNEPMQASMSMKRNSDGVVDAITAADISDYKLYRLPDRTTIASNSQKQVKLFEREAVPVEIVYRGNFYGERDGRVVQVLKAQNREDRGLGVPLPAGNVAVFEPQGGTSLLVGENKIGDRPVGLEVEVELGEATQVTTSAKELREEKGWTWYSATVSNANPFPIHFEATFNLDGGTYRFEGRPRLSRKYRYNLWTVEVPAHGSMTLTYRFKPNPD